MRTVALIIAGDAGSGFVRSKYLEPYRGTPMIEHVVAESNDWPVDERIVVLGPDADPILEEADLGDATIVIDPEWGEGLAASLRVGVDLLLRGPTTDRVVLALADQPGVDVDMVGALLAALGEADAAVPKYRYRRGWPVAVSADLFDLLLGLEGPTEIHDVLESHANRVTEVWVDRLEPPRLRSPSDFPARRSAD